MIVFIAAALFAAPFQPQDTVTRTAGAAIAEASPTTGRSAAAPRAMTVQRAAGPIRIDGDLSDAGWSGAQRASGFVEFQPREGVTPPVETEVLLTYDDSNLYLAFIASDPAPGQIRATLRQRDQVWEDDFVGVIVDPHGNQALGYMMFANPRGVQIDLQVTPQGEDPRIDFVFATAGTITEEGYVVEMAIPFSSLRFPDRPVQSWRITFVRNYPRSSRHMWSWTPISQGNPCLLCQLGTLDGIEGIRSGGTLEILPALVASQSGRLRNGSDPGSFKNGRVTAQPSVGMKYIMRSGWTAEATLNPDFSQVESDAAQVDVNTTFALFYPERRPFFQEGMDLYDTPVNVFYSRSINAPQAASRFHGHLGRTSFGYIGARDEHTPFVLPLEDRSAIVQAGSSLTHVFRVRHNVYGDSHVGGLLTDRRLDGGGSGTTASVDAMFRFREVYRVSAHLVGSYTQEPDDPALSERLPDLDFGSGERRYTADFDGESFGGRASSLQLARNARVWSFNVAYNEASPTYRADAGFQTRNDFRRVTGWSGLEFRPDRHGIDRIAPGIGGGSSWSFQGLGQEAWISPSINVTLPRQTNAGFNSSLRRETFRGLEFDGIRRHSFWINSNFSSVASVGLNMGAGRALARNLDTPEIGNGTDIGVWSTLKPFHRLVIEPSLSYSELSKLGGEKVYSGYIARTRVNVQYNRELQFRMVLQYNDFSGRLDVEPLVVYQLNPFSMFYVGSTFASREFDGVGFRGTDRQYFAKVQYLFRR
jgi:hypothetical protein